MKINSHDVTFETREYYHPGLPAEIHPFPTLEDAEVRVRVAIDTHHCPYVELAVCAVIRVFDDGGATGVSTVIKTDS